MTDQKLPVLLIVEDDEGLQRQLKWAYEGYEVVLAGNRDAAIEAVRLHEPAVVTLDLGLPPDPDGTTEGFETLTADPAPQARHQGHRRFGPWRPRKHAEGDRARRLRLLPQAGRHRRARADRRPGVPCRRHRGREPPARADRRRPGARLDHQLRARDAEGRQDHRARRQRRRVGDAARRFRHRQGAARPRRPREERPQGRVHRHQLRRHSRRLCSRPSCSATSAARSPARSSRTSARSRWRRAAPCSSTRSATSRCRSRSSCCASSRSG